MKTNGTIVAGGHRIEYLAALAEVTFVAYRSQSKLPDMSGTITWTGGEWAAEIAVDYQANDLSSIQIVRAWVAQADDRLKAHIQYHTIRALLSQAEASLKEADACFSELTVPACFGRQFTKDREAIMELADKVEAAVSSVRESIWDVGIPDHAKDRQNA